jgi:signal transduction histidine kinase
MGENVKEMAKNSVTWKSNSYLTSTARLLYLMALSIFLVEAVVMIFVGRLRLPATIEALVDPVLLVVILSPLIYYFLFRPLLRHIKDLRRMEESLKETEKHLRRLSAQLLSTQEQERRRISRELHDELGQALTLMKLQVRQIENGLHSEQTGLRDDCEHTLKYIDLVIEDVRRLSHDLCPAVLEGQGLTAAIRWLVGNLHRTHGMNAVFEQGNGDLDRLFLRDAATHIYRTIQEALTNIGKHSQARNASVIVSKGNGMVSFLIMDDGKGIDVKHESNKDYAERGLGLSAMEERVRMLGGRFDIWSEVGKGTRITFMVPGRKAGEKSNESLSHCAGR